MDSVYLDPIIVPYGIDDRTDFYSPEELDCEWVNWDCDNVSVNTDWEEND
jgi:hypothetical protein